MEKEKSFKFVIVMLLVANMILTAGSLLVILNVLGKI